MRIEKNKGRRLAAAFAAVLVVPACAAPDMADGAAPSVDVGAITPQQLVSDSGWTMDAQQPVFNAGNVSASVVFVNNSGASTRKAGACLVTQVFDINTNAPIACTGVSDTRCNAYKPSNGSAYCFAPDNSGSPTCWVRPGSQASYCVGSPANGGVAIGPGTYTTPSVPVNPVVNGVVSDRWVLDGCFNGCAPGTQWQTGSISPMLDATADDCTQQGLYWAPDGTCWPSQEQYDCESQTPPSGSMCLYYLWQDNQCKCIV